MKKSIGIIFMCLVLILTSLYIPTSVQASNDTQNVDRLFTYEEVSAYRTQGTYPTKEGYVFAGWYQDSSLEVPVNGNTPSNGAYAKFVSEKVLTVRFQLKSGTTTQSATTDLRMITSVDSLLYHQVGFKLQVGDNPTEMEITSQTAYNTIVSNAGGQVQQYYPNAVFDQTESKYFVTKILAGIQNASFEKELSFTPFWITLDGTEVTGTTRTIEIAEEVRLVANPLGFIAATHTGDPTTVEQITYGGEEVVRANFRKILFQDVIDANNEKGEFFDSEYTHIQFDVYLESVNTDKILVNTSQISPEAAYADGKCSDWTGEGNKGEFVRTYKDGVRANLEVGAWYTVCLKVENWSTDVSFCSPGTRSVAYMKNLTFAKDFPEERTVNPLGFIAATHDGDPTIVEKTTFEGEDVVRANFRKVLFQDVMNQAGEKGRFFSEGYKYVQFDVYFVSISSDKIMANTSQVSAEAAYADGKCSDWTGEGNKGEFVRTYKDGVRANLEVGAWYTVCLKVENWSTDVSFCSPGTRSVAYMKNLTFTHVFPDNVSGFVAGEGTALSNVTKDGEMVVKAVLTGSGKRVYFEDVMTASGEKGSFFDDGYEYVAFDMYVESVTEMYFVTSDHYIWTNCQGYEWRNNVAGNGKQGDYLRSYLNGVRAPIDIGAWYTVYMKVTSGSPEVNICAKNGAATIYLKNLIFTNDFPEEGKIMANPLGFVAGNDTTSVTKITMDGESVMKVEGNKVCFQDLMTSSGEKGQFFNAGYRYVTFDMYIEAVAQNFLFNTSQMNIWTNGAGYDWTINNPEQGNYLRTYKSGARIPINKGAWYTVSMKVENYSTDVSVASQNGVATIYLKNLTFANDFPEDARFTPNPLGFEAGTVATTVTKVTKDGEAAIKVEGKKVIFEDVMATNGGKGLFFSEGCQYITFDMYTESGEQFWFNTSNTSIWTNGGGYNWTVNGSQGDYLQSYQNGVFKPINKGGWYTVSMKVTNQSPEVSISSTGMVIYLKNLVFYQGVETPSTYNTVSNSVAYQTYYFDSVNGNDANSGLSANEPKKSVTEANRIISSCVQETPTKILFRAGSRYTETLKVISFKAKKESPLQIGVYGETENNKYAIFSASPNCVEVSGSNVRVSGLELTCPEANRGFYVYTSEAGAMSNVVLKGNYLHDINFDWYLTDDPEDVETIDIIRVNPWLVCSNNRYTYQNSGIYLTASTTPEQGASWFENVWVEQNEITRVSRVGIFINSDWARRPGLGWGYNNYVDDQTGYYPHKNVNVLDNDISYAGGDSIVVTCTDGGFIQGNTSYHAQYLGRDGYYSAGIWCLSSKNLVIQYNEAAYTSFGPDNEGGDGQGFDIDGSNQNILFQYNYSHHNAGGGILLITAPTTDENGNKIYTEWKYVTIRNNVFADNDGTVFHIQGKVEKLFVENNTIVIPGDNSEQGIIKSNEYADSNATGKDWVFTNNIFYLRNKRSTKFEIDFCPNAQFTNNIFYNFEDNFLENKVKNYTDCYTFNPQIITGEAVQGIENMVQFAPSESQCFTSGGILGMILTTDYLGNLAVGKQYVGAFCNMKE